MVALRAGEGYIVLMDKVAYIVKYEDGYEAAFDTREEAQKEAESCGGYFFTHTPEDSYGKALDDALESWDEDIEW